jgi:hypothetical protein
VPLLAASAETVEVMKGTNETDSEVSGECMLLEPFDGADDQDCDGDE